MSRMQRDVLLFAGAKQVVDSDRVTVELPDRATAADVLAALGEQHPQLGKMLPACRLAVDCTYVGSDDLIPEDSEVALIPPVSGG